jgi:2-amino-4-hydroxy-6-hydroxymethyldihydropteridine diphosphokinase
MQYHPHRVFVGLGSNLGDSITYLDKAVQALCDHYQISKITLSRYYESKPHGPQDQPDYINAVCCFKTNLSPHKLLTLLQDIEKNNDRKRSGKHWGARTLDLDLLLYDNIIMETETLTIPHPWMVERAFVLYPLQELSPDLVFPNGQSLMHFISKVSADELQLISC